ncbi:helical backbone metal receptor [Kallotenue papyrolyticum]|uniref:helical backbone metal receptor n=1 Tax=Kallotenue papyrolyticum TaxID=1325125 RepID=UPI0004AFE3EE|nr:helical backbone metal receptor [Kallotenue papyrolyticum]
MLTRRYVDALGREVVVPHAPRRIVSLVPSLTEWLFAIGAGERVVGVTDFCLHPAAGVAGKTRVRGTKNPDRAAIMALQPDLVIANREENRERDVRALAQAGLAVYVTDVRSVAGAIATLAELARIVDASAAAEPLVAEMRAALDDLRQLPLARPRVLVPIWRDPWMVIGADTYAHDLLTCCGAFNLGAQLSGRYPRVPLEALAALQPDLILLPSEPYRFSPADLPALRAVWQGPVAFVDGELLTWYGPRLPQALRVFRALLQAAAVGHASSATTS